MGSVCRGTDTRLGRPVAIKVSSREFSDRFEREARAISSLNHPNICTLYDVGPNYLVMELVEGETLSHALRQGPLTIEKLLQFVAQPERNIIASDATLGRGIRSAAAYAAYAWANRVDSGPLPRRRFRPGT